MKVRCLGFECTNMIEDTVSHGTCQHCVNEEAAMMHGLDICSKHQQALGEGDICGQCEAEADALVAEINRSINMHGASLKVAAGDHRFKVPVYSFNDAKRTFLLLNFNSVESAELHYGGVVHPRTHVFK